MAKYEIWQIAWDRGQPLRISFIDSVLSRDEAERIGKEEHQETGQEMGLYVYRESQGYFIYQDVYWGDGPFNRKEYAERLKNAADAMRVALYSESMLRSIDRDYLKGHTLAGRLQKLEHMHIQATNTEQVYPPRRVN